MHPPRSHLAVEVAARELTHRRTIFLTTLALVALTAGPILVHPVTLWLTPLVEGLGRLGAICLAALHLVLTPVHHLFHGLLALGLGYAAWDRLRAWWTVRQVLASLEPLTREPAAGDPFWTAAWQARIDPRRIGVVPGLPNPAFTVGWFRPRIYLARELAERLSPDELLVVLAHEGAHLTRRDPLRFFGIRFLVCTFFWLPILRRLAEDLVADAEVQADDTAIQGRPLVLATAILRLSDWPRTMPGAWSTASFHGRDLLDRRIRRLVGAPAPLGSRMTWRSALVAGMASLLLWASSVVVAHPLPDSLSPAHARHCENQGFAHLICIGASSLVRTAACPHTRA